MASKIVPHLVKRFRQRELALVTKPAPTSSAAALQVANPFLPRKNPETGRWAPPKYSRRRQADLVKAAKASHTLHLLPPGPKLGKKALKDAVKAVPAALLPQLPQKHATTWARQVAWTGELKEKEAKYGAPIKMYAGRKRMFKGHKWQRTLEKRQSRRRMLMRDMRGRVRRFKSVRLNDF